MVNKHRRDPYDVPLDREEQEIEDALDFGKLKRVRDYKNRAAGLKEAAASHLRKNKQINVRISERDLIALKAVAADEGLPYQTLVSSLLHKFVSGHTICRYPLGEKNNR